MLGDESAGDLAGAEISSSVGQQHHIVSGLWVRRTIRVLMDFFSLFLARTKFMTMLMRAVAIPVSTDIL